VRRLLADGQQVVVIDDLSKGSPRNLGTPGGQVTVVQQDITAGSGLAIAEGAPDAIFHLAAMHYIPDCNADPARCLRINVDGTRAVLEAAATLSHPPTVVLASSAAVYAPADEPHAEDDAVTPVDVYGYSKRWAEELTHGFGMRTRTGVGVARLFNVFGPGETNPHLIPSVICQLQAGGSVRLGNLSSRRDYIFVDDVAEALVRLADHCRGGESVTVNVGTGQSWSGHDIVQAVAALAAGPAAPAPTTDPGRVRPVDRPVLQASNELARKVLGWTPRTSLWSGLRAAWDRPVAEEVACW
jgi:UDP-glucose 4-epimerase